MKVMRHHISHANSREVAKDTNISHPMNKDKEIR